MSRAGFSVAGFASLLSERTGEVWLVVLELSHADLGTPIRLVNNTEGVTYGGDAYTASRFDIVLPTERRGQEPRGTFQADDTTGLIATDLRSVTTPLTGTYAVILASALGTDQIGPVTFELRDVTYGLQAVAGAVVPEPALTETWPQHAMDPSNALGLYGPTIAT